MKPLPLVIKLPEGAAGCNEALRVRPAIRARTAALFKPIGAADIREGD